MKTRAREKGKRLVLRASHACIPGGWTPALPNFGGSVLFIPTPFDLLT